MLLVLGLINVTQTVAQSRDFPVVLDSFFVSQGIGHYSATDVGDGAGLAVALSNVLCLVLAIAFSVPRLREKRTAFWIPLVCAAVSVLATLAFITAALLADPAFAAYVSSRS